jgi:hypothetical protein
MDENLPAYMLYKEVLTRFRISRPTGDRRRERGRFPRPIRDPDSPRGKLTFLTAEVLEYERNFPRGK